MKNDVSRPIENKETGPLGIGATLNELEQILSQLINDVELFRSELKEIAGSIKE